jgi:DHA2 family multidrug resistance protein
MINTWQLSQIQADTTIGWILFLLTLRGIALGLTVQTTIVTALSVVRRSDLARGSSLSNATRLVVQSIGVAILATVLASTISPEVQALQQSFTEALPSAGGHIQGICEPVIPGSVELSGREKGKVQGKPAENVALQAGNRAPSTQTGTLIERACRENIAGFELAYQVTFYAACAALLLGLMLPGWPAKWEGRQEVKAPPSH